MSKFYGYTGKILRINLSEDKTSTEPLDQWEAKHFLGGRGFNAYKLYKEVPARTEPLGPMNKLMIATGPLVGTMFPTASRFNVFSEESLDGHLWGH